MQLPFCKMHGLGNDFVVLDNIRQPFELSAQQIQHLGDRHFGIGCDQILIVAPATRSDADVAYRIYNADGEEVEQCGNGARCIAEYLYQKHGMDQAVITAETAKGEIHLYREANGLIKIDMGKPDFTPTAIGLQVSQQQPRYRYQGRDAELEFSAVSMGNPHAVIRVEDVAAENVAELGRQLQSSDLFRNSVNVGFLQVHGGAHVSLRVYERGVGETLACGSGACAAVVVGICNHGLERTVKVSLPGGDLTIHWPEDDASVWMTGPATMVYEGTIEL